MSHLNISYAMEVKSSVRDCWNIGQSVLVSLCELHLCYFLENEAISRMEIKQLLSKA